jgi:hypothetical protein
LKTTPTARKSYRQINPNGLDLSHVMTYTTRKKAFQSLLAVLKNHCLMKKQWKGFPI